MKKFVVLLVIMALLCGCAPQKADQSPSTENSETIQNSEPTQNKDTQTDPTQNTEQTDPTENTATEPTQLGWQHEAALTRFLEDTNHNGTIIPYTEQVRPGTRPEVWMIPQPKQNLVGQTVDIVLAQDQQVIPFYFTCDEKGNESLFVFITADRIPMLICFKVQLGGIQGLYRHIQNETVFQGYIFDVKNVCYEEGNIYAYNCFFYQEDIPDSEILNDGTDLIDGICMGVVGTRYNGEIVNLLKGAKIENMSPQFSKDVDWMYEILQRFSIDTNNS